MAHKTLVALYDNLSDAREAVEDLVEAKVARDSINLIANDATKTYESELSRGRNAPRHETDATGSGIALGGMLGGLTGLLVGLGAFAIPGVGPIVAAGPIIAALSGAAAGAAAGGIVGGLTDLGISESEAHAYAEGVRRGGSLVSVKLDEAEATRVRDILEDHNPVDIETREASWREAGWKGFDPKAKPYGASEIAAERELYSPTLSADEEDSLPRTSTASRRL